jgi:hypothetical protein
VEQVSGVYHLPRHQSIDISAQQRRSAAGIAVIRVQRFIQIGFAELNKLVIAEASSRT